MEDYELDDDDDDCPPMFLWLESQGVVLTGAYQGKRGACGFDILGIKRHGKPFVDYRTYIKSNEWRLKSEAAIYVAGNRCQLCHRERKEYSPAYRDYYDEQDWKEWRDAESKRVNLQAHHRTYIRLGEEWIEDLTVLCQDCHRLFTENFKYDKALHSFIPIPIESKLKDLFTR